MLTIVAETRATEKYLEGLRRDQLPFAVSLGVNNLALGFQEAQRAGIRERFLVRRPWVLRHVRFESGDRATKQRPQATVRLESPSSMFAGRSLLSKFELGGVKRPNPVTAIAGSLAIPIEAPTNASFIVQAAYRPTALGLQTWHTSKGSFHGEPGLRGKRRTFIILPGSSTSFPSGGIFQRTGPGPRDLRLLFVLKPQVPIPPLLEFLKTAQQVAEEQWEQHFSEAMERALRTAR